MTKDAPVAAAPESSHLPDKPAPPGGAPELPSWYPPWARELAGQERQLGVFFDTIIVCSVTGSTQAGMIAGFAALPGADSRPRRVLGIDASARPAQTREQIANLEPLHESRLMIEVDWVNGLPVFPSAR